MDDHPTAAELEAAANGALDTPAAARVSAHLASCARCAAAAAQASLAATVRSDSAAATTLRASSDGLPSGPGSAAPELRYQPEAGDEVVLGRGGTGEVVSVVDRLLRRGVALKRIRADLPVSPELDAVFLREARLTGLLEHPGIVPIYDVGYDAQGRLYYTMRRIHGRSLAEELAAARTLEARLRLMPAFLQACHAVGYAHERGVLHRDLKPQNIMVGEHGAAYVVDWGLALAVETAAGRAAPEMTNPALEPPIVGTPAYLSPEQAVGAAANQRSDVWGLGAVLFALLTGRPPWPGTTLGEVLQNAVDGRRPAVASLEPEAPSDLAAICEKALARAQEGRYASAAALAADVDAWLHGRTVSAREYSRTELARRFVRQNRVPLTAGAAALAVLAAVVTFDELRVRREREEARRFAQVLLQDVGDDLQPFVGNAPLVEKIAARALEHYGAAGSPQAMDDETLAVVSKSWRTLAHLTWKSGRVDDAERIARVARGLGEEQLRRDPISVGGAATLVGAMTILAAVEDARGRDDRELALLREARARAQRMPAAASQHPQWQVEHAQLLIDLARATWSEPGPGAEELLEEALAMLGPRPDDRTARRALGRVMALTDLCQRAWGRGEASKALELGRQAAEAAKETGTNARVFGHDEVGNALSQYGLLLSWSGHPQAQQYLDDGLRVLDEVQAIDPASTSLLRTRAVALLDRGRLREALDAFRKLDASGHGQDSRALLAMTAALAAECGAPGAVAPPPGGEEPMLALGRGFCALQRGALPEAAAALRAARSETLWFELDWGPKLLGPAVERSPAPVREAGRRFSAAFDEGYWTGSSAAMNAALDAFAAELDAAGR